MKLTPDLHCPLAWGSHVCALYDSKEDLLSLQAMFVAEALQGNEGAIWLFNHPLDRDSVLNALAQLLPDVQRPLASGQLIVQDGTAHYQEMERFDPPAVVRFWEEQEAISCNLGFSGLRITGNVHHALPERSWQLLMEYERLTDELLHRRRMMSWCAYYLPNLAPAHLTEVVYRHQASIQRRDGDWAVIWNHEYRRELLERESQALLASFYASAPLLMGVIEVLPDNSDLLHLHDNPAACSTFGFAVGTTAGRRASELGIPPDTQRAWIDHCRESERNNMPVRFEHQFGENPDGRRLAVTVTFIDSQPDGRARFSYIAEDATERRKAEQQIKELLEGERVARAEVERASRLKDEFIAMVSHELRTPLNAMLGWAQLLRRRVDPTSEVGEGLEVMERNARLQTQLIDDLLDMSRISSGKVRLDIQSTDLAEVTRATVASIRPSAAAKEITLEIEVGPGRCLVAADGGRLQQVLWNLLTNAVKFTPRNGKINVLLHAGAEGAKLEVRDSGEGIEPEFLPYVFDRFRQADASLTRRHGGLGIGLTIVKHIIELHGGEVAAASPGRGHGATFSICLPILTQSHEPAPQAPDMPPGGDAIREQLSGIKVLVVDDQPDARGFVARVLREYDVHVILASSANEGLRLLRHDRPDILISDISMPDKDGYDLIREVRSLSPEEGGRTPAAALTAYVRADDRNRALKAGYQLHLPKPIYPVDLIAAVAALHSLSSKRSQQDAGNGEPTALCDG